MSFPRLLLALVLFSSSATAQIPPGYYDSVDTGSPAAMRSTLHAVIDDHQRYPYTSSATDTWDILELAQQDPSNSSRILDIYKNESYPKHTGGNSDYNREHSWPKSFGFPDDGGTNYPYTDCHVLFLCNDSYNSSRGNKPFRVCQSSDSEKTTAFNNGAGGGSGIFPGNSNWTEGSGPTGRWQVWNTRKGDIARAMLYMDVRYEGGSHNVTGASEPNLILTDDTNSIAGSSTGSNESVAYMGELSVILQWHLEDPVDDFERNANDVIYSFQGNRNPFVDHPEWVDCLFNGVCGQTGFVGSYCFGDGTGNACPCGNTGNPSSGCANSTFASGAKLIASGSASLSAADLRFDVFASTPNQPGLFFSGANAVASGFGITFGDGLRCAGGGVVRLEVAFADAFGDTNTTANLASGEQVGSTRYYQWWYRDPAGSPCGTGFNLSQAFELVWEL
jgi:endonuclease I